MGSRRTENAAASVWSRTARTLGWAGGGREAEGEQWRRWGSVGGGGAAVTEARRTEPGSPRPPSRTKVPPLQAKAAQGQGTHATRAGTGHWLEATRVLALGQAPESTGFQLSSCHRPGRGRGGRWCPACHTQPRPRGRPPDGFPRVSLSCPNPTASRDRAPRQG